MAPENIDEAQRLIVENNSSESPNKNRTREWTAIRDECVSGGQLTDDCNLVAATHGADIEVVMKKLVCGCILIPGDAVEIIL